MNQRAFLFAVLIVNGLIVDAAAAVQEEAVREWLGRMAHAVETLNYRGTVVYLRDDKVETLHVVHRIQDGVVNERIYSLNGAQREVLRDGGEVRCLFSDDQELVLKGRFAPRLIPDIPADMVGDSEDGYRFSLAGEDRVAGLDTQIVEIFPLDEFRYGHRLWLERESGMLLRSALLDAEGRVQQQLMFTQIELGAEIDDDELRPHHAGREYRFASTATIDSASAATEASWMPANLPPGFRLMAVKRNSDKDGFEHLLFSDGFSSVSVYVEPDRGTDTTGGLDTVGAVNVYTRPSEDMLITVVGEVPASTVQEIGRQLRPVK